ncbi:putative amino-acid ABC transporter periplasmic-binding protein y4oP [Ditylenchus destructor]|uniref:Amino-acid ABC transporter periplasmic-binding protein y4oP n=1 Tax=Ditylenchus destructor TaxID=166010 RepID=A0AAD4QUT3_9BILA|nr:putative amino-acid ABC transporter periplasmic-binding protein y4oP [Ditylenchus destructor]
MYVKLMNDDGPQGASSNGFNENLALFQRAIAACGSTPRWQRPSSPTRRNRRSPTRSAMRWLPTGPRQARQLALGVEPRHPGGLAEVEAAEKFIAWATSKEYAALVAEKEGWANVPPGTRKSLYENADYQKAAPFAKMTLDSIDAADPKNPTVKPVPYVGVQFVAIPEFQGLGTTVGQLFSAALAGQMSVDDALAQAQQVTTREMTRAGYIK